MIDIQAIARHYGGEVSGGQALIPAIGHSDRDRGVAVRAADDAPDGCLVHCFNGGNPLAEKDRLRADNFLPPLQSLNDRTPWSPPRRNASPPDVHAVGLAPGQEIVATFDFHAADGALLYRKHRIEPGTDGRAKSFQYDRPDGKGGWLRGAGEDRVPYRLPDLLSAPQELPILMAEGEAKADRLAEWGFLATSHKDWKSFEFSGYVKGRTVFILPDNDETGYRQAKRAIEAIEKAEGEAVELRLPSLPEGGDVLDWNGTADDLRKLLEDCADPVPLLALDDAAEWLDLDIPARRWLLKDWFPIGEAALWTGAGAVGKSLATQQLAVCVASGAAFLGVDVIKAPSVYITCEDSTEEVQRRFQAIASQLGSPIAPSTCLMRSWKGETDLELAIFDHERRMRPTGRFHSLRRTVLERGARLLILDNTSHLFGGDENVKREVATFTNLLNGLAAEMDGVVLLLGHPNKTGLNNPNAGDANQFGGSVGWENQVRSRAFQSAPNPEDPDAREITNPKANYSPRGNKLTFRWWKGAFVRDDDLPPEYSKEIAQSARAQSENERFLECLRARAKNAGREVGPNLGPNYAPARFAEMPEAKGMTKQRFAAAMERLFVTGAIATEEVKRKGSSTKTIIVEAS